MKWVPDDHFLLPPAPPGLDVRGRKEKDIFAGCMQVKTLRTLGGTLATADFAEIELRVAAWAEAHPKIVDAWRKYSVDSKISKT